MLSIALHIRRRVSTAYYMYAHASIILSQTGI
jgi:hypothetical protein